MNRKQIIKIISIVLLMCISFNTIACSINENVNQENTNNRENDYATESQETANITSTTNKDNDTSNDSIKMIDGGVKLQENINSDYIKYLSSYKNKDYEMKVSETKYSEDELIEKILPTCVDITITQVGNKTGKEGLFAVSGNIYDIDDDYIYILSCQHGFQDNHTVTNISIMFITKESINIPIYNVYRGERDYSILKVPKDSLSNETLNSIKSINIDNFLNTTLSEFENNDKLYCVAYSYDKQCWKYYYNKNFSYGKESEYFDCATNSVKGTSGAVWFNEYGAFYGIQLCQGVFTYTVIYDIEDMLKRANPNYFS